MDSVCQELPQWETLFDAVDNMILTREYEVDPWTSTSLRWPAAGKAIPEKGPNYSVPNRIVLIDPDECGHYEEGNVIYERMCHDHEVHLL